MNNDKPSNIIPIVDVTAEVAPTEAEAKALGREAVMRMLDRGDSFLMLSLGSDPANPQVDVCCACTDEQIPPMVMTAVTLLGLSLLGPDKVQVLPPELTQGLALQVGMKKLFDMLKANHAQAQGPHEPQTPVSDIRGPATDAPLQS